MVDAGKKRDAGRRLATDLRELREERGIEADAILEATRLTADIFESFDETALVDHPAFNRVYLRSIVTSYARVLEIDEDDVLAALEEALDGRYHGALRKKYLDKLDYGSGPSFALIDAEGDTPRSEAAQRERSSTTEPTLSPVGEADPVPTGGRRVRTGRALMVVFGVVAVIFLIWWLKTVLVSSESKQESEQNTVAPVVEEILPEPEPERVLLGDSIRFDIVAPTDLVERILVKVDGDLRRPYWIEIQDTLTFFATESITFERELDVADILMDGYLLSDSLIGDDGQLVMTRERGQVWLDSLVVHGPSLD